MDIIYLFKQINTMEIKTKLLTIFKPNWKKEKQKKERKNNSQGKYKKELCNLNIMFVNRIW